MDLEFEPCPLNPKFFYKQITYEFACTCKNTNPNAKPNKVIKNAQTATLIISDIRLINFNLLNNFRNRYVPIQLELMKMKKLPLKKPILN